MSAAPKTHQDHAFIERLRNDLVSRYFVFTDSGL
jgi:hypothetical protein